jgi:hypothetical protein
MVIRLIAPAAGLALAVVAGAHAQPAGTRQALAPNMAMHAIDADKDGTISAGEAKRAATANFAALDTDHDGTLDQRELMGAGANPNVMAQADRDKDGTLDQAEFARMVKAQFKAADADREGTLDRKELRSRQGEALLAMLPASGAAEAAQPSK